MNSRFIASFIFFALYISSCSENPFFGQKDQPQLKLEITGNVILQNEQDHSDIIVWIEGLDIITKTNSAGDFKMVLENPESLSGGPLAWNGVFKIYYYVANFKYATSEVLIKNGEFVFDRYDLTNKGALRENIALIPLVKIETTLWPEDPIYERSIEQKVRITIRISRASSEQFTFTSYIGDNGEISSYFLKRVDGPVTTSYINLDNYPVFTQDQELYLPLESEIEIPAYPISAGQYIVVPFIIIQQPELPSELLYKISEFATTFTFEYLKIPFKVEASKLVVLKR